MDERTEQDTANRLLREAVRELVRLLDYYAKKNKKRLPYRIFEQTDRVKRMVG